MKKIMLCASMLALTGCASSPSDIGAQYVSPEPFMQESCAQLSQQDQTDTQDLATADRHQRHMHESDEWGVALIGVPVGSVGGDKHKQIAHLKGELDAIHTAERGKNCVGRYSASEYNNGGVINPPGNATGTENNIPGQSAVPSQQGWDAPAYGASSGHTSNYTAPNYQAPNVGSATPSYSDNPFR